MNPLAPEDGKAENLRLMRAHYLQHVPFEGPGSIEPWLQEAGFSITWTRLFEGTEFPAVRDIDLLVILGGPMSVNDESTLPWLGREKAFVRDAIEAGKPVLGICLGAQLIARALGAAVFRNPVKEIGWFPVEAVPAGNEAAFRFPKTQDVFHWHGETFDLPAGAVHLASSPGCRNQAFQIGSRVIGLQFHLETTPDSARAIVTHCRDELAPGEYVQAEDEILSAAPEKYRSANRLMNGVLTYLTRGTDQGAQPTTGV